MRPGLAAPNCLAMSDMPSPDVIRALDRDGFATISGALAPSVVRALAAAVEDLWAAEGEAAGVENYMERGVRRLANLAAKGDIFRVLALDERALAAARYVCGGEVRLSMLNARDVPSGSAPRQPWHCDTDGGAVPDADGSFACTAMWWLDDATTASGATMMLPGSHRTGRVPATELDDLNAALPGEVVFEAQAGDLLLLDGHCWHAGGANRMNRHRRAILVHYYRAGIPRREDRRPHIGPDTVLGAAEQALFGLDEV